MIALPTRALRALGRGALRPLRRSWRRHGLVLNYHRVAAPSGPDLWRLKVSPARFRQQLEVLRAATDVVPLAELDARATTRRDRPVVAITFDDGYADNLTAALPLLSALDAHATFFITTAAIGRREPFWWDALAALVSDPRRLAELHARLWVMDEPTRTAALRELAAGLGRPLPALPDDLPLSHAELAQLCASPLVEIGAHTVTHCHLPSLSAAGQREEIMGSRLACERLTGRVPSSFAYPYGALDSGAPALVAACGFQRGCSTEPDAWWQGGNPLLMPRFGVGDWDGARFARMLRWAWLP